MTTKNLVSEQDWLDRTIHYIRQRPFVWAPALVVLLILAGFVFQKLNATTDPLETDPTTAGQPLSNPDQHLHTLAIDPAQPGVVYLGSHYGIFVSTDDGKTWPQPRGVLNRLMVTSLTTHPGTPGAVGMIGIAPSGVDFGQNGVYFSHDMGKTWTRAKDPQGVTTATSRYLVAPLATSAKSWLAIYVGVGLFATNDDGQTWRLLLPPASNQDAQRVLWSSAAHPQDIWVGSNLGVKVSHDGGAHWGAVDAIQGGVSAISASAADPQTLYIAADAGIFRSTDAGATFTRMSAPVAQVPFDRIAVSAQHANLLYGLAGQGVWLSTDGGATWNQQTTLQTSHPMSLLIAPDNDQHIYVGFYAPAVAAASTDSGKTWNVIAR